MSKGEPVSKIPTPIYVCLTVAFLAVVGAFVVLSATGSDAAEFRGFLIIVLNLAGLIVTGGAATYAGKAASQTNGNLDQRIKDGVSAALDQQRAEDVAPGGELRRG
jgi:hypothetical protein